MPAWVAILIAAFILVDLVVVALVLHWSRRRAGRGDDNAPGWYALCARCGWTRSLSDLGGIKLGATPRNTPSFMRCRGCRQRGAVRIAHISRMSAEQLDLVEAHEARHANDATA